MSKLDLHDIRQDYSKQALSETDCAAHPLEQFRTWLDAAMHAQVHEPTAMNVATVDEHGHPNARIVLLKEVNDQGFVFFTNYQSRKGRAIAHHPHVALTFFWPELERQVRIEGRIGKLPEAESDAYFETRPYTSRIGAWASHQSEVLSSKADLMARAALVGARHPLHVPRPPHWGGYVVTPQLVEFWQGRPSRLHDRIQYRLDGERWTRNGCRLEASLNLSCVKPSTTPLQPKSPHRKRHQIRAMSGSYWGTAPSICPSLMSDNEPERPAPRHP